MDKKKKNEREGGVHWCDNGPGSLVPLVAASGFQSRPEHHYGVLNTRRSLQEDTARREW